MKENIWAIVGALGIATIAILFFVGEYGESPADTRFPEQASSFSEARTENIRLVNARKIADGAYPNFSPDGRWISFGTLRNGLFIISKDGSGMPRQVGNNFASSSGAAWSWDSKKIYYKVRQPIDVPPYFDKWVESVEIITNRITKHPEISIYDNLDSVTRAKKGETILSFDIINDLFLIKILGGNKSWNITPSGSYISAIISPDRTRVLVQEKGTMLIYATDGSGLLGTLGKGSIDSWSPDSKVVLYEIGESDGHYMLGSELYAINADGSGRKQLTFTPDIIEVDSRWSTDGRHITFWDLKSNIIYIADIASDSY